MLALGRNGEATNKQRIREGRDEGRCCKTAIGLMAPQGSNGLLGSGGCPQKLLRAMVLGFHANHGSVGGTGIPTTSVSDIPFRSEVQGIRRGCNVSESASSRRWARQSLSPGFKAFGAGESPLNPPAKCRLGTDNPNSICQVRPPFESSLWPHPAPL